MIVWLKNFIWNLKQMNYTKVTPYISKDIL